MASKIIRGDAAPEPAPERPAAPRAARPGVVDGEVYDAHVRAREIVRQAEEQAEQILDKAKAERSAVLSAAREAGRQEGLGQVSELLAQTHQERGRMMEEAEAEVVRLALTVAERIVGKALEVDQDTILDITARAIESVRHQKELVLRVNPQDAVVLRNGKKKLMDLIGRTKDIAVRDDPEVERGGCIIETDNGTVDAQLDTQLEMLEQLLLGEGES